MFWWVFFCLAFQRTYLKTFLKTQSNLYLVEKPLSFVFTVRIQPCIVSFPWVMFYTAFFMILQVNGIAFHPVHGTLATVGSDGRFSFWDKDARTKLKTSEQLDQPISACCFNHNGNIFAYASSYDWSKVRKV